MNMFYHDNTALLIVDMQNAFCSRKGSLFKRGIEVIDVNKAINAIKKTITIARKQHIPIIFTKLEFKNDYSDAGLLVKKQCPEIVELKAYIKDSHDSRIVESLQPRNGDVVISKTRYDPFLGTNLCSILRKKNIHNLVVVGFLTNICVESSIRSAFDLDFETYLIKEATSTYSEKLLETSLYTINKHFGTVISISDFNRAFKCMSVLPE